MISKLLEHGIHIEKGPIGDDKQISDLAVLLYDAFEAKLAALGIRRELWVNVSLNSLVDERAFFAYQENRLVGVVGLTTRSGKFLHFRLKELRKHVDLMKALFSHQIARTER